jgi:hypothetical protein
MKTSILRTIQISQAVIGLAALVACGGYSQDPTSAYNFPRVAPHNVKVSEQIKVGNPFHYQVLGENQAFGLDQMHVANFVEGKSRKVQVQIFKSPEVKSFTVDPQGLPKDATLDRSTDDIFTLQWTPPYGSSDHPFQII